VEWRLRYADWKGEIDGKVLRCVSYSLLWIMRSIILEMKLRLEIGR
jgi:uncharacterized membrane protein